MSSSTETDGMSKNRDHVLLFIKETIISLKYQTTNDNFGPVQISNVKVTFWA